MAWSVAWHVVNGRAAAAATAAAAAASRTENRFTSSRAASGVVSGLAGRSLLLIATKSLEL